MNRDEFSAVEILEDSFFRLRSHLNPHLPECFMFVSGIVVFELNVSTQPSMTSKAHDMSMGDSGEVGLLRMRLALVCPIQHQL